MPLEEIASHSSVTLVSVSEYRGINDNCTADALAEIRAFLNNAEVGTSLEPTKCVCNMKPLTMPDRSRSSEL